LKDIFPMRLSALLIVLADLDEGVGFGMIKGFAVSNMPILSVLLTGSNAGLRLNCQRLQKSSAQE